MSSPLLTLRHRAEFAVFHAVLRAIDRMPVDRALAMASRIGDIVYALDFYRRGVAKRNIRLSGIAAGRAETARIARASFRSFAQLAVESLKADDYFRSGRWREMVDLQIDPAADEALKAPGRGAILAGGHIGNWEIASRVLATFKPVVGITKNMNNPLTDRLVKDRRARENFTMTPKRDADAGRLLEVLNRGHVLGLLVDQHARSAYGEPIRFFGRHVSMHKSAALLHLVSGAPLILGCCVRTGNMKFLVRAYPPVNIPRSGDKNTDVRALMLELNSKLEDMVREFPEQYLWAHRRWRPLRPALLAKIEKLGPGA